MREVGQGLRRRHTSALFISRLAYCRRCDHEDNVQRRSGWQVVFSEQHFFQFNVNTGRIIYMLTEEGRLTSYFPATVTRYVGLARFANAAPIKQWCFK